MILHPMSSMAVAKLAARLLGDGSWTDASRVEARGIVSALERLSIFGPAAGSPAARVMAAHASRLSHLATSAIADDGLDEGVRDLSWLTDIHARDEAARISYAY